MTKNTKYLLIILAILSLAAFYFWFGKSETPASLGDVEVQTIAEERLELLRRLKNLRLETSILEDERFRALLPQEELAKTQPPSTTKPGRINPFLPF